MKPVALSIILSFLTCATLVAQVWEHIYPGPYQRIAYSICTHYDDGYLINIAESGVSGYRTVLFKTDEDGNIIWEKTIGNFSEGNAVSSIFAKDGEVYIAGGSFKFDSAGCSFISQYNECIERHYTKEFGTLNDYDYALKILPSLDSNLFLEIQYYGIDTAQNPERATMLKLTPNGDVIWQTNFTPAAFGVDFDNMILTLK